MTTADFSPDFRSLIDLRLEAIDTALWQAKVPYSDRRNIVGEVETQIYELLSRRGDNPGRDDVLAVLDSLDPPDSYVPEEARGQSSTDEAGSHRSVELWQPGISKRALRAVAKRLACLVGAAALVGVNVFVVLVVAASRGVIPWLVTVAAIAWLNFAGLRHWRSREGRAPAELLRDLRNRLAAWIAAENREPAAE